jgi:sporulation protein YlmC with PRC-barrel domain
VTTTLTRELERLTHSGVQLADPATDVRDRDVYDRDGQAVGSVSDVLVDPERGEVRFVEVTSAGGVFGIGRKSWLIPVEATTSGDPRTVYVERTREEILAADPYRPAAGDEEEAQYAAAYAAYGLAPYWNPDRA